MGRRSGYLPQEPRLENDKTVRENVELGVAELKGILERYNDLAMNYSEETADEMTALQDEIEAKDLWDLDSKVDSGHGRPALPRRTIGAWRTFPAVNAAAWPCVGCCSNSPICCSSTSRPTISMPRPSRGSKGICAPIPARFLIVTHDRYFLDNVTGWILELDRGRGIPL